MSEAPEPVRKAALFVLHHALVYARNITIRPEPDAIREVNDLMEAIHGLPQVLDSWDGHDVDVVRLYLGGFDHTRSKDAPDLVRLFDFALRRFDGE